MTVLGVQVLLVPVPEAIWGRTLGKLLTGLRVRTVGGATPPPFEAVAKRWIVGLAENVFCFGLLPIIVILTTPNRQRLGDLWAKTVVTPDADW